MSIRKALWSMPAVLVAFSAALAGPFDIGHGHDDDDHEDELVVAGMLDLRFVATSKRRSSVYNWASLTSTTPVAGGENKLRYGGKDINADEVGDRRNRQFAVPQASLLFDAPVLPATKVHLQANLDADSESGNGSVGIIEVYSRTDWTLDGGGAQIRLGAFIPALSWEHPEPAWSTRYTLTPSALATWAGEDLRNFGAEGAWSRRWSDALATKLTAGVFSGSDQAGWLLLERGWALHDFQPDLNAAYQLQSLKDGAVAKNRPFKEQDGRMGWQGRVDFDLFNHLLHVGGGLWDNNGDEKAQVKGSHLDIYHTQFVDAGAKLNYRRLTVIAQALSGKVDSLSFAETDIKSTFLLASYELGRFRISGRAETFAVDHLEAGMALTGALIWRPALKQEIAAEFVTVRTEPPGGGTGVSDTLASVNYRLRF